MNSGTHHHNTPRRRNLSAWIFAGLMTLPLTGAILLYQHQAAAEQRIHNAEQVITLAEQRAALAEQRADSAMKNCQIITQELASLDADTARQQAEANKHQELLTYLTTSGIAVEDFGKALRDAAEAGNLELLNKLIAVGTDLNSQRWFGGTAVHAAAAYNHPECLKALIDAGANVNYIDTNLGTPLHCAASAEIATMLIAAGADVNKAVKYGTPLAFQTRLYTTWKIDLIKVLIDSGADVNAVNGYEQPILFEIIRNPLDSNTLEKRSELVRMLIAAGADVNKPNPQGMTPVHIAAFCNNLEILKILIEAGGDIHKPDNDGKTALHHAKSIWGTTECETYLRELENKANK